MGSGIIRWYGLIEGDVALLEEAWPCWRKCVTVTVRVGFEVSVLQPLLVVWVLCFICLFVCLGVHLFHFN